MASQIQNKQNGQCGFTLVEMSIVLVIAAFLIVGVMKGYAVYRTAQAVSTVAQISAINDGTRGFQKTYWYMPGDLKNAQTRLPNCSSTNFCSSGDGNGRLNVAPDAAMVANEGANFFLHLYLTDFIPDVGFPTSTAASGYSAGNGLFASSFGPSLTYRVGYIAAGATFGGGTNLVSALSPLTGGHYIALASNNGLAISADASTLGLTPSSAQMIDSKIDDGKPNTGSVRGSGAAWGSSGCVLQDSLTAAGNLYNTAAFEVKRCAVFSLIR